MAFKIKHNRSIGEPFLDAKSSTQTFFTEALSTMDGIFLSRLQMLLLHAVIVPLFKNLDTFNELNCVEVWIMFLANRSVFFAFGVAKGCLSANVLCGQPGL